MVAGDEGGEQAAPSPTKAAIDVTTVTGASDQSAQAQAQAAAEEEAEKEPAKADFKRRHRAARCVFLL